MANKKVSPSEPLADGSGQASKLPWTASDRLTDPDGNVLVISTDSSLVTFKATATDTTPGYLNDKVAVESPLQKATLSPGGNESIQIGINDPADADQVLTGSNPAAFGLAPLKHVEGAEAPSTAIAAALAQVNAFQVVAPSDGDFLLVCSGWATSDGAGVLEMDLYNATAVATIANTLRKESISAAGEVSGSTSITAPLTSGDVIYPRWAFTGGNNATLERVSLSLVRVGA